MQILEPSNDSSSKREPSLPSKQVIAPLKNNSMTLPCVLKVPLPFFQRQRKNPKDEPANDI